MRKDGQLTLVHCRHGNVSQVDAGAVARLLETAREDGAAQVLIVSSTDIPEAAREVAQAGGAKLIDGAAVREMLAEELMDLQPIRGLPGVDAQQGEAHLITRGNMRRSRSRRSRLPAPGTKQRRLLWVLGAIAAVLVIVAGLYAYRAAPPPPARSAPADATTTQEVPLPAPP
jgi:hypothetical protein